LRNHFLKKEKNSLFLFINLKVFFFLIRFAAVVYYKSIYSLSFILLFPFHYLWILLSTGVRDTLRWILLLAVGFVGWWEGAGKT
jgi:hypothetical protein